VTRSNVKVLGHSEFIAVLVTVGGYSRVVAQGSCVDVLADFAMDLSADAEMAQCAWDNARLQTRSTRGSK
jgi:hypothetical protein